ncbi:SPOR domain-containing protein [Rhizobium sp. KVB221]|uniref:SPOR domain-containing protein n=1 Tax=Rhizobium setariae TaxID=2801340 RepID=A0A936YWA2_9HYPH|nr:SPOR domain-containing protein [Rhizobium setariae]MBL0374892.1 SPOR domain-containing protein [Rhizobium setariae]
MADKQLLLKKNADDGFFADDDPMAELARIVGFEPLNEEQVRPASYRREPEFNLEEELLKEFEQFEAPERIEPVSDAFIEIPEAVVSVAEPPSVELEPAIEPGPISVARDLRAVETNLEAPFAGEPVRPVSHPVFELEDEIFREFAAFDARRTGQPAIAAAAPETELPGLPAAVAVMPGDEQASEIQPHIDNDGAADIAWPTAADKPVALPASDEPARFETADDMAEAELDQQGDQPEDAAYAENWHDLNEQLYEDFTALDVADVADSEAEIVVDAPLHADADFSAEQGWQDVASGLQHEQAAQAGASDAVLGETFAAIPVKADIDDEVVVSQAIAAELASDAVISNNPGASESNYRNAELDALLDDVERFPVAGPTVRWPRQTPVLATSAVSPSRSNYETARTEPSLNSVEDDIEVAGGMPVSALHVAEDASVPTDSMAVVIEPFDDSAFELDLSEIELDLLDVETLATDVVTRDAIAASPEVMADIADVVVEPPVVAPRSEPYAALVAPTALEPEDYSSLHFDPTQISTEDDVVEAIAEMDVPEAPPVDHETLVSAQPDYDIDIDAEMAHIFARGATTPPPARPQMATPVRPAPAAAASAQPALVIGADLDEFERALEEDFRKSLTENRTNVNPDRVALSPAGFDSEVDGPKKSRNVMVLAASVAAVVLLGGAGVYAYIGGSDSVLATNGEPKIILADKEPVKVVPEDKGGQTVPNQDKAVYDRVAGDTKDAGKQERLVTSNEEPVDVVQKTLMPENLPMDDEGAAFATDTPDTADPRLLPESADDENVSTSDKVVSGVAPRKVRTMVVRSDGTLVAREEMVPADVTPSEPVSREVAMPVEKPVADVPERLSAVDQASSAVTKGLELKPTEQAVEPAADPVADKLAALDEKPAADTDDDVLSKVAEDNSAAEKVAAAPAKSIDNADQSALAEAANAEVDAPVRVVKTMKVTNDTAPVPESRPVDQPVNVVGAVTDQGNVRPVDDAGNVQQVAAADPVAKPAENVAVPAGSYVIQIASLPSESDAQASYNKLSSKFASVIGGRGVDIRKAEIKNKGTYYRVRIPAGSKQQAQALCEQYKQAGGSCLVSK